MYSVLIVKLIVYFQLNAVLMNFNALIKCAFQKVNAVMVLKIVKIPQTNIIVVSRI